MAASGHAPDWRDAEAYAPLLHADRSLCAWEWLRRDPGYRLAAERALETGSSHRASDASQAPERWGLHAFLPPGVSVPDARPVWCAEVHPYVLGVDAGPPESRDLFAFERLGAISTLVRAADGGERLLLSDGFHAIRLDMLSGTIAEGPVELKYRLTGLVSAERPLLTLRRLLALWRSSRFSCSLHPKEARAKRWVLMLRAHDALSTGADQREIAAALLSSEAGEPHWRSRSPSIRSQAQRLVRGARNMAAGGYLELLQ